MPDSVNAECRMPKMPDSWADLDSPGIPASRHAGIARFY
jgi:hypothetical protein